MAARSCPTYPGKSISQPQFSAIGISRRSKACSQPCWNGRKSPKRTWIISNPWSPGNNPISKKSGLGPVFCFSGDDLDSLDSLDSTFPIPGKKCKRDTPRRNAVNFTCHCEILQHKSLPPGEGLHTHYLSKFFPSD